MSGDANLLKTPLCEEHRALSGRLVPFAGWLLPVQYTSVLEEAKAVRNHVGMFDVSHMGRLWLSGTGAREHIQYNFTNNVDALEAGAGQYGLLLNERGGVLDDLIVYRLADNEFLLVVNAANTARDLAVLQENLPAGTEVDDRTRSTFMVAVQGPEAMKMVSSVLNTPLDGVGRFHVAVVPFERGRLILCRTGYTGEDGFEIIGDAAVAATLWRSFIGAGATPCGLGARDTLRIEAGYPLYGHEIHEETTPVEAGLMWCVKLQKGDFRGREAVLNAKRQGPQRKLVGFVLSSRAVPRQGNPVYFGEEIIGEVTSGTFSPTREVGLGMAYVPPACSEPASHIQVEIRGTRHDAVVVRKNDLLGRESKGGKDSEGAQ